MRFAVVVSQPISKIFVCQSFLSWRCNFRILVMKKSMGRIYVSNAMTLPQQIRRRGRGRGNGNKNRNRK